MPIAEFEEKQYETPANIELGLQHAAVFAPGQVLEAVVGYDAAINLPQNAPIWALIGVNAPQGLLLVPNLWQRASVRPQAPQLPSTYVSLIFQYKRPRYLHTSLASQWHYWGAPYYRFEIRNHQQSILENLEITLAARAVLRYACPTFWTYADLQSHQAAHNVLSNSTFVSANSLKGHTVWTYNIPGNTGFANPRKEEISTTKFASLWSKAKSLGLKENLFEHLRGLAGGIGSPVITDNNSPDWLTQYIQQNQLNTTQRQSVADIVELGEKLGEVGASWFVADLDIQNPP